LPCGLWPARGVLAQGGRQGKARFFLNDFLRFFLVNQVANHIDLMCCDESNLLHCVLCNLRMYQLLCIVWWACVMVPWWDELELDLSICWM
jgi:hypothetical protein